MSNPIKVLVVDDSIVYRQVMQEVIARISDAECVGTAASGQIALRKISLLQPDLVLLDVVMPEMDGPTLLKEMRKRNPELRIIFVSGYAEDAFQRNLPEHGQFAFLPKPFTLKQLAAAVKETMAG